MQVLAVGRQADMPSNGAVAQWNMDSEYTAPAITTAIENTLMLEKIEGRRRRGQQRMRWLDGIINSTDMNVSKLQKIVKDKEAWHAAAHEVAKSRT